MIAKLAIRMAFTRSAEHRWRILSILVSSFLASLMVLTAIGVLTLADRVEDRGSTRTGAIATTESSTDSFALLNSDSWEGRQIESLSVMPATAGGTPATALGIREAPGPGASLVSPALDRLIRQNPELEDRYPNREVLSWSAVTDANELLGYRGVPFGDSLGNRADAIRYESSATSGQEDSRQVGDGPLYRLSSLGTLSESSPVSPYPLVFGVLILVVAPALGLATIGLRSASSVRQSRLSLLLALGVSRGQLARLTFIEGAVSMLPGVLLAGVTYAYVSHTITRIPFTDNYLVPDDLALTGIQIGLLLVALVVICCLVSTLTSSPTKQTSPRPTTGEAPLRWPLLIPLGVSTLLFFSTSLKLVAELYTIYPAILTAIVGVPLACLFVVQKSGARLAESESPSVHIVGSSMSVSPRAVARPYLGLAMLIVLTLSVLGWASHALHRETPRQPPGTFSTAVIYPNSQDPAVVGELGSLDPRIAAMKIRVPGLDGPSSGRIGTKKAQVFTSCDQLRKLDAAFDCSTMTASADLKRRLLDAIKVTTHGGVPDFTFVDDGHFEKSESAVLALSKQNLEPFDKSIRDAVGKSLPGVGVSTAYDSQLGPDPLAAWIVAGMFTAIAALAASFLLSSVDRHIGAQHARSQMASLGVRQRTVLQIEGLRVALPLGIVIAVSGAIGALVCNNMLTLTTPFPVAGLAWTLGIAGVFLGCSVGFVCAMSRRSYFGVAD